MSPVIYTGYLLMPALTIAGYWLGGAWNFITPAMCFVIHPLLNMIVKEKQVHQHGHQQYPAFVYTLTAILYVPVLLVFTGWAVTTAASMQISWAFAGFIISTGIVNGVIGFTLAHEFIHRSNRLQRATGYILLLQNLYMHYGIEHVRGHHVYACTDLDPHTARTGESFYKFLPRAISLTFLNAWQIEQKRIASKKNRSTVSFNSLMAFIPLQLALLVLVFVIAGWKGLLFFIVQAFVSVCLLHVINYLQHYGLMRRQTNEGRYEKMNAHHSWNSGNRLNGFNLFQLDNHADHHMHPDHNYQTLRHLEESPRHPTGYSGMIVLALVPPLWFRVINKVTAFNHKNNLS